MKLNAKAWLSLFALVAAMGLLLFPPAGTLRYWQAWLYLWLLAFAALVPFLIWRLLDEEQFLDRDLPGYGEYRRRVRHRLVPFVW